MKRHLASFWKFALAMATIVSFFLFCFFFALSASAAEYQVKEGETLSVISRKTGVSVAEIRRANNLQGETIFMGQKLQIPDGQSPAAAPSQPAAPDVRTANVRRALPVILSSQGEPSASPVYTVNSGDTLLKIARRYNTTVDRLRQLNGLTSDTIQSGQKIRVREDLPATAATPTQSAPSRATTPTSSFAGGIHSVAEGESLGVISRKTGVSVSKLRELNNIDGDTIFVGQKLVIGTASQPAPANTAAVSPAAAPTGAHTVNDGETLFSISRKYNVSVPDLRAANRLQSDSIWVNQRLVIPGGPATGAEYAGITPQVQHNADAADSDVITPTSAHSIPVDPIWEKPGHYLDLAGTPGIAGLASQNHAAVTPANNPVKAEPSVATHVASGKTYTVQPGDTLWKICRDHKVNLDQLRAMNSLDGDVIVPGRTLQIPSS